MSLISLFKRLSFVLKSIRAHLLKHVPAAAKDAEAELKELASKNPFASSKTASKTDSKTQSSAEGERFSPLERKVEDMASKL